MSGVDPVSHSNGMRPVLCIAWMEVGVEDSIHFLHAGSGTKLSVPLLVMLELKIEGHVSFDSLLPLS